MGRFWFSHSVGWLALTIRHDWHATILHLLGLNHERLTYRDAGRDMRLTDVKGRVAKDLIA